MSRIVEVNEEGAIYLPPDVLGNTKPHARYEVKVQGNTLILSPVEEGLPFWKTASPQERAEALRQWGGLKRPPSPPLPDEAMSRENIYD